MSQTKSLSSATTRSAAAVPGVDLPRAFFAPAQIVTSTETRRQYRIERLLGHGGFGQVYLTQHLGRSATVPPVVCIKVSERIDGWPREEHSNLRTSA
jgi:hypothetical protein